jgi:hypothetical protein
MARLHKIIKYRLEAEVRSMFEAGKSNKQIYEYIKNKYPQYKISESSISRYFKYIEDKSNPTEVRDVVYEVEKIFGELTYEFKKLRGTINTDRNAYLGYLVDKKRLIKKMVTKIPSKVPMTYADSYETACNAIINLSKHLCNECRKKVVENVLEEDKRYE